MRPHAVRKVEPPVIAGRVPPHNLDAEAAVLSAILLDAGALDVVTPMLRPKDFYSPDNGRIYEAALAVREASSPVDVLTVNAHIRDRDGSPQGLATYLAQLCDSTPAVSHVEAHAVIVRDKARARRMIATCQVVAAEGYGDVGALAEWLNASEQAVFECAAAPSDDALEHVGKGVREAFGSIIAAAESGKRRLGIATGYDRVDALLGGFRPSTLTVLAARPGMGKSSLASNIAVNVAATGKGVAFFTLEMSREECIQRMLASEARVPMSRLREASIREDEWPRLTEASQFIQQCPIWIDPTPAIPPLELRAKVRRAKADLARQGRELGLVIVDHLGLVNPGLPPQTSRNDVVGAITATLKVLCSEARVPVLACCQLNRAAEKGERRPTLTNLRDSGNIEQDADNVVFLYRDEYYTKEESKMPGIAEAIVAKQRNGPLGTAYLRWTGPATRFDNLAPESYPQQEAD